MGLWARLTGTFRLRGMLAEPPEDQEVAGDPPEVIRTPRPTPTERVPPRPPETPSIRVPETPRHTAGTPTYGSQGGTPSTRRIHNPTHFR